MQTTPNADAAGRFIAGSRDRNLPDAVLDAARMCLVDWFGVAIAARQEGAAQAVHRVVEGMGSGGGARTLLGHETNPAAAALANGTMAHCLDFDDTHVGSLAHLSGPTWAATLGVGMSLRADAKDMLKAFVTGFEVGAGVGNGGFGDALNTRTLHSTGVCGCFAAAAAASALYGLGANAAQNALGLAATQAAGLTGSFGTMSKPFHAGKAAFNGVLSAQLAHAGFVSARSLIEAQDGIGAALIQDRSKTVGSMTFQDGDWEVLKNTFKPYASCLLTHPVIDTARKLHPRIAGRPIESVVVNVHPMAVQLAGKTNPRTPLEGKFSTAFCTALGLSGSMVTADDFSDERMQDPGLRDVTGRVQLNIVEGTAKTSASLVAILKDGTRLEESTPLALGNPGNPMSWADMERKFLGLTTPVMGAAATDAFARLRGFSNAGDLDAIFAGG